jgi:release factor glutamine methyltransferase
MSLTLVKAWTGARDALIRAGVDSPVIDARLLVEAACEVTRLDIVTDPHREISDDQKALLDDYVARRARREPVSRILGRKGFWKIMVGVSAHVLSPRPETEVIVEAALAAFPQYMAFNFLDLGVGSGAIALAILAERPAAKALGVDVSSEALATARENAANLGLDGRLALLRGDWTAGLADASFDLVVSNPPYVKSGDIAGLDPEVREYDPHVSLDGGADGLEAYRVLAPEILRVLKPGAPFMVEIGADQKTEVESLFHKAGAMNVTTILDLSGRDRVVTGVNKLLGISDSID